MANSTAEALDNAISDFFSTWSLTTTLLLITLLTVLIYPLVTSKDPDVHPFLLARQSTPSPIRQSGESATYRAIDVPHGYPLRSGLGVKDEGAPKWSPGRRGDLRDVWRQACKGSEGKLGKVATVLGREKVMERDMAEVSQWVNGVGWWMQEKGVGKVAVALSNSVELLVCVFGKSYD